MMKALNRFFFSLMAEIHELDVSCLSKEMETNCGVIFPVHLSRGRALFLSQYQRE